MAARNGWAHPADPRMGPFLPGADILRCGLGSPTVIGDYPLGSWFRNTIVIHRGYLSSLSACREKVSCRCCSRAASVPKCCRLPRKHFQKLGIGRSGQIRSQRSCICELFRFGQSPLKLGHIPRGSVLSNELGDVVTSLTRASRTLNVEHRKLALNVAKNVVDSGRDGAAAVLIGSRMTAPFWAIVGTNQSQLPASPQARADSCF
jgi:hypothetical protein